MMGKVFFDRLDALPDQSFEAEFIRFSAGITAGNRALPVEVDKDHRKGLLRPGYFGYLAVMLGSMETQSRFPKTQFY